MFRNCLETKTFGDIIYLQIYPFFSVFLSTISSCDRHTDRRRDRQTDLLTRGKIRLAGTSIRKCHAARSVKYTLSCDVTLSTEFPQPHPDHSPSVSSYSSCQLTQSIVLIFSTASLSSTIHHFFTLLIQAHLFRRYTSTVTAARYSLDCLRGFWDCNAIYRLYSVLATCCAEYILAIVGMSVRLSVRLESRCLHQWISPGLRS